jgi:putative transcriptional regulator
MRLDGLLKARGWTFYRLAKESGIGHSTVSKLRHNAFSELRIDVINALCRTLECQPGDLMEYVPEGKGTKARKK